MGRWGRVFALSALVCAGACTPTARPSSASSAISFVAPIDAIASAMILGASADRRRIAYAAPCDPMQRIGAQLYVLDDWTGLVASAGPIASCNPAALTFSPDGRLMAFPSAPGIISVYRASTDDVVPVSRAGESGLAIAFAPDSRWLVVASSRRPPIAALDAWDADLAHHVEIAADAYVNPFGSGKDAVRFSPDGEELLFIGGVTAPVPLGSLTLWQRTSGASTVLAAGVASYTVDAAFRHVAYLAGVTYAPGPPSVWLHGQLAIQRLADGHVDLVESDIAAAPQQLTRDGTLLYLVGPPGGPSAQMILKAARAGTPPWLLDTGVLQAFAPTGSLAIDEHEHRVAYLTAFDPPSSTGELHVATISSASVDVVAADAVPLAFGWAGHALAYLHAPTVRAPFGAVGTLAAWSPASASSVSIGDGVAQLGLHFDVERGKVLFTSGYQAGTGELQLWRAATGGLRDVAGGVVPTSVQLSPDGELAGALATTSPTAARTLIVSPLSGPGAAQAVDSGVTSFVVADGGRVVYTTATGLYGALVIALP